MIPILSVKNLSVSFQNQPILSEVSFSVDRPSVTTLVGPSGAGKSTLLRSLNRLLEEEIGFNVSGEIHFRGENLHHLRSQKTVLRRKVGLIFQRPVIFPISIAKNVSFGVTHLGLAKKRQLPELIEHHLKRAFLWDEVKHRLHRPALELSVGQQQRLAIARTLALEPEMILLDEPTSALDAQAAEKIEELILTLKHEHPIILVTHSLGQARRVSDRLVCLYPENGQGRLLYFGPPQEIPLSDLPPFFQQAFNASQ